MHHRPRSSPATIVILDLPNLNRPGRLVLSLVLTAAFAVVAVVTLPWVKARSRPGLLYVVFAPVLFVLLLASWTVVAGVRLFLAKLFVAVYRGLADNTIDRLEAYPTVDLSTVPPLCSHSALAQDRA
jgi:hypothetical protein